MSLAWEVINRTIVWVSICHGPTTGVLFDLRSTYSLFYSAHSRQICDYIL